MHVVRDGEQIQFDVDHMEKPYDFFQEKYFFPHCDANKLTTENPLVEKLREIEQSCNFSAPDFEIESLKIPRELAFEDVPLYSEALDDWGCDGLSRKLYDGMTFSMITFQIGGGMLTIC